MEKCLQFSNFRRLLKISFQAPDTGGGSSFGWWIEKTMCFHLWNVWQSHSWYRIELIPEGSHENGFRVSLLLPSCSERVRLNHPSSSPLAVPLSGPRGWQLVDCDLSLFDVYTLSFQLESELYGLAVLPRSVKEKSNSPRAVSKETQTNGRLSKKEKKTARIRIFHMKS